MAPTIWLSADALGYPEGGGHCWVYLNWALGLRSLGCHVIWLEGIEPDVPTDEMHTNIAKMKSHLAHYGLEDCLALYSKGAEPLPAAVSETCLDFGRAAEADLLLNLCYSVTADVLRPFRKTALIDIDPGLLQIWLSEEQVETPRHDLYFSIGETVGRPDALFSSAGLEWHYTPPCVALDWWPVHPTSPDARFTTVTHWCAYTGWISHGAESYHNDKRCGFLPYFDLPRYTRQPLELALCLGANENLQLEPEAEQECADLRARGWHVRHAYSVASTPASYQAYIQSSRGEFSCAKPSCVRLQNAWISDRTLCSLASGKPAVVEHTGPSSFLPDADGLFRFRDVGQAVRALAAVGADYELHSRQARALAEEFFDAKKVVQRVLERALN